MADKPTTRSSDDSREKPPLDDAAPEPAKTLKGSQASDFSLALLLLVMSGLFSVLLFNGAGTIALILLVPGLFFLVRGIVRSLRG